MNKTIRPMTVEELRAEAAFWQRKAFEALALAVAAAVLILCFGIGQFFF